MNRQVRLAAAVLWCASAARAVDWTVLKPQGYVSDFAGVVDSASRRQLDAYCAAVEQATGAQIALVTIASLQNEPIEGVTRAIFRAWNLDQKPHGNAVIWLVAVENRRDQIQAGSGLAAILTNGEIAAILRQARPALARRQYAQSLMAVAEEIGTRIASARHVALAARLPRRAHRGLAESIPWLLAAGALLLSFWLFRVLGPPARRVRTSSGFGGDEKDGW
jgi:uncharacterized protein